MPTSPAPPACLLATRYSQRSRPPVRSKRGAVDRLHLALHHHPFPEPARYLDRYSAQPLGLFIDPPGLAFKPEPRLAAVLEAEVSLDRGRDQPIERLPKQLISPLCRRPSDRAEQVVGHQAERKGGRQTADYAACATGSAVCADQFQGMSSSHCAAGQSAAIFPVTSAM